MIKIKTTDIETLQYVNTLIPELNPAYTLEQYYERLKGMTYLGLIAEIDGQIAGFKVGYALDETHFYSWMGGVVPMFRRKGVAKILASHQEEWLKERGFKNLSMKTRNNCRNMLLFAIKNNFLLTQVEHKGTIESYRIYLEKTL